MSMDQFVSWMRRELGAELVGENRFRMPALGEIVRRDADLLSVVISSRAEDRQGDVLEPTGADIREYLKNPVVLWAHDYKAPPIGRAERIVIRDHRIEADVRFAPTPFATEIQRLYAEGFLRGWSVGFIPKRWELRKTDGKVRGYHIKEWELLEFSAVPIPANPDALSSVAEPLVRKALEPYLSGHGVTEPRGAIPFHETPTAPEDAEWDAAAETRQAEVDALKVMCAWFDSTAPELKGSYKLPHHKARPPHPVVWRGVAAAMAALLGARGGVRIPDRDRRRVYEHLARHYKQFDKQPPEFRLWLPEELPEPVGSEAILHLAADDRQLIRDYIVITRQLLEIQNDLLARPEAKRAEAQSPTAPASQCQAIAISGDQLLQLLLPRLVEAAEAAVARQFARLTGKVQSGETP